MKRIFFTALGMFAFLQSYTQQVADSTGFKSRKLRIEEINLVSSYYNQDGNNSAVTGGVGSEKLTDIANVIDVKLLKYDKKYRKHTLAIEAGIDYYTSASSDMIDLKANSSASSKDFRFYPSVNWNMENEAKGNNFGIGLSSSTESDYQSYGIGVNFSKKSRDRNTEFGVKLQAYFDRVKLIAPVELRTGNNNSLYSSPVKPRNSFNGSFSWSRVINERLQLMLLADIVFQQGYLGLPFHRVYMNDGSLRQEKLPDSRFKLPLGLRAAYFLGDHVIIRGYYRFYTDDWGLQSHTASIELPVKISPFFSFSPFYRFYKQRKTRYFNAFQQHELTAAYYTSNYDLSAFTAGFFGAGLRFEPAKGVFGIKKFNMLELRYGHYRKNIGMNAHIVSLNFRFK